MPNTYDKVASNTLSSATGTVDFTGIPSTYTDLVLVATLGGTISGLSFLTQFNGDTGTNYSCITYYGAQTGTPPGTAIQGSGTYTSINSIYIPINSGLPTAVKAAYTLNIQNYASSNVYKHCYSRYNHGLTEVNVNASTWRSASAINRITMTTTSSTFLAGSVFTIYGIKAA
jgi:hypothetical protein